MTRKDLRIKLADSLWEHRGIRIARNNDFINALVDIVEQHADDILKTGRKIRTPRSSGAPDDVERSL